MHRLLLSRRESAAADVKKAAVESKFKGYKAAIRVTSSGTTLNKL